MSTPFGERDIYNIFIKLILINVCFYKKDIILIMSTHHHNLSKAVSLSASWAKQTFYIMERNFQYHVKQVLIEYIKFYTMEQMGARPRTCMSRNMYVLQEEEEEEIIIRKKKEGPPNRPDTAPSDVR